MIIAIYVSTDFSVSDFCVLDCPLRFVLIEVKIAHEHL